MWRWSHDERGLALITVLVITLIATGIGIALVGLMNTDLTHAGIQHAKGRSLQIAQAGLETAKAQVFAASDPVAYVTPGGAAGVTEAFGDGQYTYWVDAGPATGCGAGLKTLEAEGQVQYLAFTIRSRVRACGIPGAPFLTALFGVSLVEASGSTSRTYIAPFTVGTPGNPRGGHIGSFTELNFPDAGLRLNALSENGEDTVTLRNPAGAGTVTVPDYTLFGHTTRPIYEANPSVDPTPWILTDFGDIIKGQPTTGPLSNRCNTYFACVTTATTNQNSATDILSIASLRADYGRRHLYMNSMQTSVLPRLCDDPNLPQFCVDAPTFRTLAQNNTANASLNAAACQAAGPSCAPGLSGKTNSEYTTQEFTQIINYLASNCPTTCLQGTVFVDTFLGGNCDNANNSGCFKIDQNVNLGGYAGNVTLAVAGDLVIRGNVTVTNRHDLTTTAGRQTPGILVFGLPMPRTGQSNVCMGETSNGSGRLIMCGGNNQFLVADGFVFTRDGLFVGSQATFDLIGGMYHENRNTSNPSYTNQNSTVVVRFDPLSMTFFNTGITIVSWQQLR